MHLLQIVFSFRFFLAIGGLCGAIFYFWIKYRSKTEIDIAGVIEAVLGGAGIPGGVHLAICAFYPHWLVQILDQDGNRFHHDGLIELGEWHTIEILAAGIAMSIISFKLVLETVP